jgi:hypothetical protein
MPLVEVLPVSDVLPPAPAEPPVLPPPPVAVVLPTLPAAVFVPRPPVAVVPTAVEPLGLEPDVLMFCVVPSLPTWVVVVLFERPAVVALPVPGSTPPSVEGEHATVGGMKAA